MAQGSGFEIRDQCRRVKVPVFLKRWGGKNKKQAGRILDGRTRDEMPRPILGHAREALTAGFSRRGDVSIEADSVSRLPIEGGSPLTALGCSRPAGACREHDLASREPSIVLTRVLSEPAVLEAIAREELAAGKKLAAAGTRPRASPRHS